MRNKIFLYYCLVKLILKGRSINSIRKIIEDYKLKTVIVNYRTECLFWGFDLSKYTDEEILKMTADAAKQISNVGLTAEEASNSLKILGQSMIELQPKFN